MASAAGGFTEKDEALVKESYEIMKLDLPHYSLRFFTIILEIAPPAKDMFSFLRDSEEVPDNNPKLKAHALKVFKMTCEAAVQLREKGELVTCEAAVQLREKGELVVEEITLKHLGSIHFTNGVVDAHFQVVKEALLRTVEEAVGEKWSIHMKAAWSEAYDNLSASIKAEMNINAAAAAAPATA